MHLGRARQPAVISGCIMLWWLYQMLMISQTMFAQTNRTMAGCIETFVNSFRAHFQQLIKLKVDLFNWQSLLLCCENILHFLPRRLDSP